MSRMITKWPLGLIGSNQIASWSEGTHAQKTIDAAGEKFAILLPFDGSELDQISVVVTAGTAADTITLTIEAPNTTHDTRYVTGLPDGTAIANSTTTVSNKGGASEWITFTFGSTGPSPSGYHWVVFTPSSAGAFSIKFRHNSDWQDEGTIFGRQLAERLYDNVDWENGVTLGPTPMRVKKKDGTYLAMAMIGHPPFSNVAETINVKSVANNDVHGVKFIAPYNMEILGVYVGSASEATYATYDVVLIDSSNTEIARGEISSYWGTGGRGKVVIFPGNVSLTKGETYRIYLVNTANDVNNITVVTITANYSLINLSSGEFMYTTANHPPSEGGTGTWTDTSGELPLMYILGQDEPSDIEGDGATGGETSHVFFS